MKKYLSPNEYIDSVFEVDIANLKKHGIKAIIVDIDNTLVSWETKVADERVKGFINKLKDNGFNLCMLSNATKKRVRVFNNTLNIHAIHNAAKPSRRSFKRAMELMGSKPQNTAVIGDQVFTDILGGNRLGLYTILVSPIAQKEFIWTKLVRRVERFVLKDIHPINGKTKK